MLKTTDEHLSRTDGHTIHPKYDTFPTHFECRYVAHECEEGGFFGEGENLAGVFSEADSLEQLDVAMVEAFQCAIEAYMESGEPVPWKEPDAGSVCGVRRRVLAENVQLTGN